MRRLFAVSICTLMGLPALASPAPQESWGKAGVSFAQYRADSLECGLKGYYTDISDTADAKELVRASRQLDNLQSTFASGTTTTAGSAPTAGDIAQQMGEYAASQQHIIEGVRPDQRYRSIKQTLETSTAQCLEQRGYSKFMLTKEQRQRLSKLKSGSDERRAYLYSLASDSSVLQSQKGPAER